MQVCHSADTACLKTIPTFPILTAFWRLALHISGQINCQILNHWLVLQHHNGLTHDHSHIFFLVEMSSIFACGLQLHRKTHNPLPILVCFFFFHFPQIAYTTKTAFLTGSFLSKQSFCFFLNSRISEAHICHQGWFRKICIFASVISRK